MGRPNVEKKHGEGRSPLFAFRHTESAKKAIKSLARQAGLRTPDYLRSIIDDHLANKRTDGPSNAIGGQHS